MADKMVQPDKDQKPVSGETRGAMASGGSSQGKPYPNRAAEGKPSFHGGQSEQAYYGDGQLGDEQVGKGNQNAPSEAPDEK